MSDLPEAEVVRRQLEETVVGRTLAWADGLAREVTEVGRHGRILVVGAGDRRLYLPLAGTARLRLGAPGLRTRLSLGEVQYDAPQPPLEGPATDEEFRLRAVGKGMEPLSNRFSLGAFKRILEKRKRSIKFALSQDSLLAGLGWRYPDEMLHLARLRPDRTVPSLADDERRDLYFSIFQVLHKAVRFGGLSGNGWTLTGKAGGFERFAAVVGRAGLSCPTCHSRVRRVVLGRRSSFFCPRCQR